MSLYTLTAPSMALLPASSQASTLEMRAQIEALHEIIDAAPDGEIETRHYYANGLYAREIHVPAGTWVVGAIHANDHINVLSKGEVLAASETGAMRLSAPATFAVKGGKKTLGYALSDAVWTTFCANPHNLSDPDTLFAALTLPDYPDEVAKLTEEFPKWLSQ